MLTNHHQAKACLSSRMAQSSSTVICASPTTPPSRPLASACPWRLTRACTTFGPARASSNSSRIVLAEPLMGFTAKRLRRSRLTPTGCAGKTETPQYPNSLLQLNPIQPDPIPPPLACFFALLAYSTQLLPLFLFLRLLIREKRTEGEVGGKLVYLSLQRW